MCSPFRFSIQQFWRYLFYCQKTAFVCEFQHTSLWNIFFSQCCTLLVDMRFCRHVPNSPRDGNKMLHNPFLLEKVVFLASKTLMSPIGSGKKKN
jgi:hypothetical protein